MDVDEVLTVPDDRIPTRPRRKCQLDNEICVSLDHENEVLIGPGDIVFPGIIMAGTVATVLRKKYHAALLAALLTEAGAVKVDSKFIDNNEIIYDAMLDLDEHGLPPGEYYVLHILDAEQ